MLSDEIRIGIVGAAGRGRSFFSAFIDNPQTTITALCDLNEDGLRQTIAESGLEDVSTYTDYEKMLDTSGIDAVVIGTPMHLHVSQSIMALERNIHVLCEITAGVTVDECRGLVEAAKRSRAMYMMAENCCYIRSNVLVREIARAGLFGDLYFGKSEYIHELKGLNEMTAWRRKWQTGINGNTYITHSLGPVYQWFGGQRVTKVCCFGTGHHYRDPRGDHYAMEDSVFTACRLESGGLINIRLDMLSDRPSSCAYYSLQGTKGCYEAPRGFGDKHKISLIGRHEWDTWGELEDLAEEFLPDRWLNLSKEILESGHGGGDYMEVQDFLDSLMKGASPPIGIHEALDMTLPGLISQESIKQGSIWLDVPDSREW